MGPVRKYAALPDLDVAPDIYETPELTDDASTVLGSSTFRTDSRASSTAAPEEEDPAIDRQRIDPNEARNSFLSNDTREKTTYGWIGSKRAGYKSSARRAPSGAAGEDLEDEADEEDEESLERKVARLRREVSEVQAAFQRRRAETQGKGATGERDGTGLSTNLKSLNDILEDIAQPQDNDRDHQTDRLFKKLDAMDQQDGEDSAQLNESNKAHGQVHDGMDSTMHHESTHTLSRISDFDKRLRLLETTLGVDSIPLPTQDRSAVRAVLPVLDGLDQRISTISLTEPSLDKITRQIRQMTQESEKLVEARKAAAAQLGSNEPSSSRNRVSIPEAGGRSEESKEDLDQTSKINALYGTLSTIESLSPLLPAVLDRLRSLRAIHADAALASEALNQVEGRQVAMADEIKEWKEGLGKVESAMRLGEDSMKENMGVINGWVEELELRLGKTSSIEST
ncbi:MAG: hypothetical protein Q9219_000242 [cf. Caloplaca sp. 3 TL-2023]